MQDFGDYTLADDSLFDVQTITDAVMTTGQSIAELAGDDHRPVHRRTGHPFLH